ncbi:MAG: ribosome maturation factor RimP [Gammaproteobacteria bacterium]|nr:MAG: ribosome maturation factor RimP [Gammaproteobacteria bacterium]RLA52024.1 MAG: ribosome maturation factor RimP [Gammaproteobacteria bacterium]
MRQAPENLLKLIQPVVEGLGFEFVGADFSGRPGQGVLRIFIDIEKGIDVDDCAAVSRQLSSLFDVEDPIPGNYQLEVSSPGLERPLYTLEHFERFKEQLVAIKLSFPLQERRNVKGMLLGVEEDKVVVNMDGEVFNIPFQMIVKAHLTPETSFKK